MASSEQNLYQIPTHVAHKSSKYDLQFYRPFTKRGVHFLPNNCCYLLGIWNVAATSSEGVWFGPSLASSQGLPASEVHEGRAQGGQGVCKGSQERCGFTGHWQTKWKIVSHCLRVADYCRRQVLLEYTLSWLSAKTKTPYLILSVFGKGFVWARGLGTPLHRIPSKNAPIPLWVWGGWVSKNKLEHASSTRHSPLGLSLSQMRLVSLPV